MLLFTTTLPTISAFTQQEFISMALEWAQRKSKFKDGAKLDKEAISYIYRDDDAKSEFEALELKSKSITAIRIQVEEPSAKWTTHCILNTDKHQVTVSLDRQLFAGSEYRSQTGFSTPWILTEMIRREWLDLDGDLPIRAEPISINLRNYMIAINIITNRTEHALPVILLPEDKNREIKIDELMLADKIKGIAHVLCISGDVINKINDVCEATNQEIMTEDNAYIYYPDKTRHSIRTDINPIKALYYIIGTINNNISMKEQDPFTSWAHVKCTAMEERLKESSKAQNEVIAEHTEWFDSFSNETNDLRQKIKELEEKISVLTESEYAAKSEAARLRERLNSYGSQRPLLYYGNETDMYDGEITDIILEYLQNALTEIADQPIRRRDILANILEYNPSSEAPKKLREEVKRIMNGYNRMSSRIISDLETIGFNITKTKNHYKITYKNDPRYTAILSSSGSDFREGKNIVQTINNMLF